MKKKLFLVVVALALMVWFFYGTLQSVQAVDPQNNPTKTFTPTVEYKGVAVGDWTSGRQFNIDLSDLGAPKDYLQLLGKVVKPTFGGQICHPFNGGRYGWTGSIYELVGNGWVKVNTYFIWEPNEEGTFMACTMAKRNGTYAFFGFYDGSVNPTATLRPTNTPKPTSTPTRVPTPTRTPKPPSSGDGMNRS